MTPHDDGIEPMPRRSEAELLAHVYRRGRVLRLRRIVVRALSVYGVVALIVVSAVVFAQPPRRQAPLASSDDVASTASPTPSVPASPSPTPEPSESPASRASASKGTDLACRNSFDLDCGNFYFDPKPARNQPLRISIVFSPDAPKAGEEVTFVVTIEDPDARIERQPQRRGFGDGATAVLEHLHGCREGFGPWTPPVPKPDRYEATFRHVYESAGTYTAEFGFHSHNWAACEDPYGGPGEATVKVVVGEA